MDYSSEPSAYQRTYSANKSRYKVQNYRRIGESGLKISPVSLGTWQNFGGLEAREDVRKLYLTAFDHGINSFDFGNNYGRPPGSSEEMFGSFISEELAQYRDELVITTKAGYDMWPGPNGRGSSLKYLVSSLDQSLKRLQVQYVDIFYSHRFDPDTPLEETAEALDQIRRSGRALYVGISSYPLEETKIISEALRRRGTKLLVHQSNYSLFNDWVEEGVLDYCNSTGLGFAAFSPLAQGLLSDKYLSGIPQGARASLKESSVFVGDWDKAIVKLKALNDIAVKRGQTLSQMAISWVLRNPQVSTAVIGARTADQIIENTKIDCQFTDEEQKNIRELATGVDVDLWTQSRMGRPIEDE